MNRRRLTWAFIIVTAVGVLYWAVRNYPSGSLNDVEASGTIETTEVDVSFQVAGRVQRLLVDEADHVTLGQVIASLDERPLQENLERARAQLEAANVAVTQQRAALALTRRTIEEQEKEAQAAFEAARARSQEVRHGPRPQETLQAEAALEAAEASLVKATLDADRARQLVQKGVYSQAMLDAAQAALTSAQSQRNRAREALSLMREGSRKEEIEAADAQQRQAHALLSQAAANHMQIGIKEQDLAAAEARVQELKAALNAAQINLDYAALKAPIQGWILLKNIEAGEVVNVGTPVFTLGDIEDVWMNVYVGTEAVGRLKLGDQVDVQVDSHKGEHFRGKIIFISQEAEFTPKNIQTRDERTKLVYRIKVSILNKDQKLKPGMPADALLHLH